MIRLHPFLLLLLASAVPLHAVEITRSITRPSASEGAAVVEGDFVVSRGSDPTGVSLTVNWQLGSPLRPATVTTDFTLLGTTTMVGTAGTVVIPANQSSVTLTVRPVNDGTLEGAEDVTVELLAGAGYSVGSNQSATITIADDELRLYVSVPIPKAYEDYTNNPPSVIDPDSNRRGAFRVNLTSTDVANPALTFSTYVTAGLVPTGPAGTATLNTDYHVVYKIGGNGLGSGIGYTIQPRYAYQTGTSSIAVDGGSSRIFPGASVTFLGHAAPYLTTAGLATTSGTLVLTSGLTQPVADNTTMTITQPAVPTGFKVNNPTPVAVGQTSIPVDGGSGPIYAGAVVQFTGDPNSYAVTTTLPTSAGSLLISPGLAQTANDDTVITITHPAVTGFAVNQSNSEPVGTTSLRVTGGTGGFAVGDVFRIGSDPVQFLVTGWNSGTSTVTFSTFTGSVVNGTQGVINTTTQSISTHFSAVFSGVANNEIRVLVPPTATRIEYGIVPNSDTTAEASETVTLALLTSTDYQVVDPTSGNVTITDDDVVVAFDPTQSRNATVGGTDGSFRVVLSSGFPRTVHIPYSIGGDADNSGDATTGDLDPLDGDLVMPANTTIATIPVHAREGSGSDRTLTLTLLETEEYRLVTTPGATQNSSASITISHPLGTVSVVPKVGATTAQEKPTAPVAAKFTVSIDQALASDLTVTYQISGSATNGTDYQNLSGSVVLPASAPGASSSSAEITVTPIDDTAPDTGETVTVLLQTGLAYLVDPDLDEATITITDDEPVISIAKTADITEGGVNQTVFTVSAAANVPRAIDVDLAWSGLAVDADRTVPATVTIPYDTSSVEVKVTATDDGVAEGDETLIATVSAKPSVYTRSTNTAATATIHDLLPVFTLEKDRDTTEGSATHGRFKIHSSFVPVVKVTLGYTIAPTSTATPGAAAGAGVDYKTLSGTVDIEASDTYIEVEAFADDVFDAGEQVAIILTDVSPPTFTHAGATPLTATLTIFDAEASVASVTSSTANGTYVAGDVIDIAVVFTQDVTVSGTPSLVLETGSEDAIATFVDRNPANTLNFTYTVQPTHLTSDLDYKSASALTVTGGEIESGSPAVAAHLLLPAPGAVGSLARNKALVIDGGSSTGKPAPGVVGGGASGGGCGLGSGFAALVGLFMLTGIALSIRRTRP